MKSLLRIINRLFNLSSANEWARVGIAWSLKFFFQIAAVMGMTIITAMFVDKLGLENLPFLYIFSAIFVIIGSLTFVSLLDRFEKNKLIVWISGLGVALLVGVEFLHSQNLFFFFGGLLIVSSMLVGQLNILLSLFIEELFSPLESERTFPIIESAEPLGGIAAGLLILLGIQFLPTEKLIYLWAGVLVALVVVLQFYSRKDHVIPRLRSKAEIQAIGGGGHWDKVGRSVKQMKAIPFLRMMFLVVFLQWMFVHILEFQYTSAIDNSIMAEHAEKPILDSHGENSGEEDSGRHGAASSGHGADSHADALTHGLGSLHVLLSSLALFFQLFIASHINRYLGVIDTMRVHPFVTIFTTLMLLFKFGFASAVTAKAVFEITSGLQRNAYHASFYTLRRHIREHAKEIMEGIIRPFGMIAGTLFLLGVTIGIPSPELQHTVLSAGMMVIIVLMILISLKLGEKYTQLSRKNLDMPGATSEKFEAIEILAQKGHKGAADLLIKNLIYRREGSDVKIKILQTLGKLKNVYTIPEIIKCFSDTDKNVQHEAVKTMAKFDVLGKHFFTQSFAKYRVTEALQELFLETKSKKIKSDVIHVFANINQSDVVPFLLDVLKNAHDDVKDDAIYVCGMFHDINAAYYLEPFLKSENPRIISNTIISLWQFIPYRLKLLLKLTQMLESKEEEVLMEGLYVLGETQAIQEIPRLKKFLTHENPHLRKHAAISLGKMNHADAVDHLFELMISKDSDVSTQTSDLLPRVHPEVKKHLDGLLRYEAAKRIREILYDVEDPVLEHLPKKTLQELRKAYILASETKEVFRIESVLKVLEKK